MFFWIGYFDDERAAVDDSAREKPGLSPGPGNGEERRSMSGA